MFDKSSTCWRHVWLPTREQLWMLTGDSDLFSLCYFSCVLVVWTPFRTYGFVWKCCVPHCTQWFCWSLSLWKMAISLGIYPTFSDKPISIDVLASLWCDMASLQIFWWVALVKTSNHRAACGQGEFSAPQIVNDGPKLKLRREDLGKAWQSDIDTICHE